MPVSLSIKNVPEALADALRERARRNHRSLQGELMAILEGAASQDSAGASQAREPVSSWGHPAAKPRLEEPRDQPGAAGALTDNRQPSAPALSEQDISARQTREGRTFTLKDLHEYVRSLGLKTPPESAGWIRRMRDAR